MKAYMCLGCEPGAYNKVMLELMRINIPRGNIFLLFGPIDVLVQFKGMKDLDEFSEKWFYPCTYGLLQRNAYYKNNDFCGSERRYFIHGRAFRLHVLERSPQHLENAQTELMKVPEVISADIVLGSYDIISPVRAKDRVDLEQVISKVHKTVPEIEGTATTIVSMIRI